MSEGVRTVAWRPDGQVLAVTKDAVLTLIDAATRKPLIKLPSPLRYDGDLRWSPSGRFLIQAASAPSRAELTDLVTGSNLPFYTEDADWNADGTKLATAGGYSGSFVVPTDVLATDDVETLLKLARATNPRPLTPEECRQYLHADSCGDN